MWISFSTTLDRGLRATAPAGLVLDQHDARSEPLMLVAHRPLELRILHALAQYVEQIEVLAGNAPGGADAEIAELGRFAGGVPALHDALERLGQFARRVMFEPRPLNEAAAQWRRGLLVLAGEIIFADRAADLLEHRRGLALVVQRLAPPPRKVPRAPHRLNRVRLVLLGDRRAAHDLPIFLGQHVADQIILMQPVHDQHDRTFLLVVEPAVEGCGRTIR